MLDKLQLEHVGPIDRLSADFAERLNVVTGDNGLGKSFLLDVCFWTLTGTWPEGRTALPEPSPKVKPKISYSVVGKKGKTEEKSATFDFHSQSWTRLRGRPPMPGLVVYAAVDGGFSVWDPARNYWRDPATGVTMPKEWPRAYQFSADSLANGLEVDGRQLCNGLVQDWVEWFYQRSSKPLINPFEYLEDVIRVLSHPTEPIECEEPRKVFVDDTRKFPTLSMPYGTVAYPHWSAGVKRIVSFAYLIVWAWVEHVQAAELRNEEPTDRITLLVDEIEAHLHPKWQRTILPAILRVVEKLRADISVQVLAATHSPLVLASLEPHFDEKIDQFFCFELAEDKVTFENPPWTTHGGHLFADEITEDMKIEAPGGDTADLHRRVWVGVGGTSEPSYLRMPLSELGIESEYDIATPYTFACFKAKGGARAYFHGGLSPQELIIPVVTMSPTAEAKAGPPTGITWTLTSGTPKLTTRFFSLQVAGEQSSLFGIEAPKVRIEIRAKGKCVSRPVSASYGFEDGTGEVQLRTKEDDPKKIDPNTVAVMLVEEITQKTVSVVLLDAASGVELATLDKIEVVISI